MMAQTFKLSLFKNKRDNKPQLVTRTWQQLCSKFQKPQIRFEKDGSLFSPAVFEPAYRCNENVQELSLLTLDYDHETEFVELCERLRLVDCAFAVHSTHSHLRVTENNPKGEARFRAVIPLAVPIPAQDFQNLWQWAVQIIALPIDESKKGVASMFYTPAKASENAPYECHIEDGEFLNLRNILFASRENEQAKSKSKLDEFLSRLKNVKQTGVNQWTACCPSHNDKTPSLSITVNESGKILVHCHSDKGCTYKSIFDVAGFSRENTNQKTEKTEEKPLAIIKASEVVPKKIEWLWYPYIPKNYVTLFSGEEGVGKSWVFCAIASGITNGFLPFTERFEPQNVLIFSAEDAADDALVPRLMKTDANLDRVFIVNERFTFDEKGLLRFEYYIVETNPVWVIIDPLFAYSDLRLDLNKPHHARFVANSIEQIAKKYSIAISYLIHFNKSKGGGDARAAVSSSQEFSNAARSILLIGKDPNDETRRALIHRKHNHSPKGKAIGYQIIGDKSDVSFEWLGESTLTEREIVDRPGNTEERAEQSEAVIFLREALRDGQRNAGDIIAEAEKLGITKQRLRTAKSKLGIVPKPKGFGTNREWIWKLPETSCLGVDSTCLEVNKNENQHLSANHSDKTSYYNDLPLDVDSSKYQHLSMDNEHLSEDYFIPASTEI